MRIPMVDRHLPGNFRLALIDAHSAELDAEIGLERGIDIAEQPPFGDHEGEPHRLGPGRLVIQPGVEAVTRPRQAPGLRRPPHARFSPPWPPPPPPRPPPPPPPAFR